MIHKYGRNLIDDLILIIILETWQFTRLLCEHFWSHFEFLRLMWPITQNINVRIIRLS